MPPEDRRQIGSCAFETLFAWGDQYGAAIATPEIWQSARLYLREALTGPWQDLQLLYQEQLLPLHRDTQGRIWASWPASEAGYYLLQLHGPGQNSLSTRVFIGARYLNASQWLQLLQDLRQRLPAQLLQNWSAQTQVPVRVEPALQPSPQERWRWLQQALEGHIKDPGLLRLLQELPPAGSLVSRPALLPLARARTPLRKADALMQQPPAQWSPGQAVWTEQLQQHSGPEAAFIAGLIKQIQGLLRGLGQDLQAEGSWSEQQPMARLAARLQQLWQQHPWHDTSPLYTPPAGFSRMLNLPLYRRGLQVWQGLHSGLWPDWQDQLRQAYHSLSLLYQYWCLLQCMHQILQLAQAAGWTPVMMSAPLQRGQAVLRLQKGSQWLSLWHERSFGAQGPVRSLSRQQRPDITLVHQDQNHYRLWVFEVKFRSAGHQPLKADLDRLHAYRDALRNREGEAVVRQAVLLYPGPPQHAPPLLQAWTARPGEALNWPLSALLFT